MISGVQTPMGARRALVHRNTTRVEARDPPLQRKLCDCFRLELNPSLPCANLSVGGGIVQIKLGKVFFCTKESTEDSDVCEKGRLCCSLSKRLEAI